jgi:cytochrome P450
MQSFVNFTNFCGDLVVKWRVEKKDGDPLSEFAFSPQDDGSLFSIDQLTNEVRLLVVGAQTTANLIAQSIVETLQMDDRGDMGDERHVQAIVEESLRKDGPATYMPRICLQDVEIAGVTIPAGSRVFLSLQSANRDETFFECPARFDINRPNVKRHVAFGFGTHFCVGAPIARVEATVALTALFSRFSDIRLSPKNDFRHRTEVMALRALREVHLQLGGAR